MRSMIGGLLCSCSWDTEILHDCMRPGSTSDSLLTRIVGWLRLASMVDWHVPPNTLSCFTTNTSVDPCCSLRRTQSSDAMGRLQCFDQCLREECGMAACIVATAEHAGILIAPLVFACHLPSCLVASTSRAQAVQAEADVISYNSCMSACGKAVRPCASLCNC